MAKEIKNVVLQITEDMHLDEERFVITYEEDNELKTKIVKKSELSGADLTAYTSFKNMATNKMDE